MKVTYDSSLYIYIIRDVENVYNMDQSMTQAFHSYQQPDHYNK